jgi:hypothetical protein
MIPQVTAAALVSENKQRAYPGQRRFDPDLGQSGRPCLDGRARRAPADGDGRQYGNVIASNCSPPRRAMISTRRSASSEAIDAVHREVRAAVPISKTIAISIPTSPPPQQIVRSGSLHAVAEAHAVRSRGDAWLIPTG